MFDPEISRANRLYSVDSIDLLFADSRIKGQKLLQKVRSSPVKTLPGLRGADGGTFSNDLKFINFLADFREMMGDRFKFEGEDGLAGSNGIGADDQWDIVQTVAGTRSRPTGYLTVDNGLYRESKNLPSNFRNDEDREIFSKLVKLFSSHFVATPLPVKRKSQSGPPFFEFDKDFRVTEIAKAFTEWRSVFHLTGLKDGHSLLSKHGLIFAFFQGTRLQPDAPSKIREVADFEYAITGGLGGAMSPTDKKAYKDPYNLNSNGQPYGECWDGFSAMRVRPVWGPNSTMNAFVSLWSNGTTRYFYRKYAFSFEHRGASHVQEKLRWFLNRHRRGKMVGIDVSRFDTSVPAFLLHAYCDELASQGIITSEWSEYIRQAFFSPCIQPDTGDGLGPVMYGDPFKLDTLPSPGLLSGVGLVSKMGKLMMTFNHLVICAGVLGYKTVLNNMEDFLLGKQSIAQLNQGDDAILLFKDEGLRKAYFSDEIKQSFGYFDYEEEDALRFLGMMVLKDGANNISVIPDIRSESLRVYVPERSLGSPHREHYEFGFRDRDILYSQCPVYGEYSEIRNQLHQKHFGRSYSLMVQEDIYEVRNPFLDSHSDLVLQFLDKPDRIHYSINIEDLPPELVAMEFDAVGVDVYMDLLKNNFNGTILTANELSEALPN